MRTIIIGLWVGAAWLASLTFSVPPLQEYPSASAPQGSCVKQALFEEAIAAAANIKQEEREYLLADIAEYQGNLGDFESALRTVAKMKDQPSVNYVFKKLALTQAENGDFQGARATALRIRQNHPYVLVIIAALQAEGGDWKGAIKSVPHLDSEDRDTILDSKVRYELRKGNLAAALHTLDAMHDKDFSLQAIMYEQAKAGDLHAAFESGNRIQDATAHGQILDGIVYARIEAGDFAGAKKLAGDLSLSFHVQVLCEIAEEQAKKGEQTDAQASFKEAADLEFRDSSIFRGGSLGDIAEHEIRLGMPIGVMKQIALLPEGYEKRDALTEAGKALLAAGKTAEAEALFERAPNPALVAVARASLGDTQGALDALRQADDSVNVDAYMVDIVECIAKRGDVKRALALISQIDGNLRRSYQSEAFQKIAKARVNNGDLEGALRWARHQQDPLFKATSLLGILESSLEKCHPGSTKLRLLSPD